MNVATYLEKRYGIDHASWGRYIGRTSSPRENLLNLLHKDITKMANRAMKKASNGHGNCKFQVCDDCGAKFNAKADETLMVNGKYICPSCANNYHHCAECGELFHDDDLTNIDGTLYCKTCRDEEYSECDQCGCWVHNNDAESFGDETYCSDCYEGYIRVCDNCGDREHDRNMHWHDDYCYCGECWADMREDLQSICDYSYKPDWKFHRLEGESEKEDLFGHEVEVVAKGYSTGKTAKLVKDTLCATGLKTFCKHDGSLPSNGFEIVTHPATYAYQVDRLRQLEKVKEHIRAYSYSECGHHIHVSRNTHTKTTLAKVIYFFAEFVPFIEFIAQRKHNHYCKQEQKGTHTQKAGQDYGDRYQAVNVTKHTIELRVFKGNTNPDRIIKNLQFAKAIFEYCNRREISTLTPEGFIEFINGTDYHELKKFCERYGRKGMLVEDEDNN